MKNKPCNVSFIRSVCGRRAPFIGVFLVISLIISLIISQPLLAFAQVESQSDTTTPPTAIDTGDQPGDTNPKEDPAPSDDGIPDTEVAPTGTDGIVDPLITPGTGDETIDPETPPEDTEDPKIGEPPLQTPPGVNPKSQSLGKYISPDVSVVDGSLNYEYPIAVPPGRLGLSPDIKLVYNNNNTAQSSIIGVGWSINIPYIQRVNNDGTDKIYTEDCVNSPTVNCFTSSLDGELVSEGNGVFVPRTENGSFLRYVYNNNSWTVTDKKGTQYKFGTSSGSRQYDQNNPANIFTWMLEKEIDPNGNTISYSYFTDQNQIYPDTISYNQSGVFTVKFNRTSRIINGFSFANVSYLPAFRVVTAWKISSIEVRVGANITNKYTISVDDSNFVVQKILVEGPLGSQGPSLLTKFRNSTDEGSKTWNYDPTTYKLPADSTTGKVYTLDFNNPTPNVVGGTSAYSGNSFKDINGDGLPDIIRWVSNKPNGYSSVPAGNQVFLNTGTSFDPAPNFYLPTTDTANPNDPNAPVLVLDYNCPNTSNPSCVGYYGNSFIDINGDGLPDIVRWKMGEKNGYVSSDLASGNQVFLNTGTGFQLDPYFILPTDTGDASGKVLALNYNNENYYGSSFIDINGDGRPDIVRWDRSHANGYSSLQSGNQVFLNTGTGFMIAPNFHLPTTNDSNPNANVVTLDYKYSKCTSVLPGGSYGNFFMDVNGDGLPDVVRWTADKPNGYDSSVLTNLNNSGNQIFLNTGSKFVLAPNFYLPTTNTNNPASGNVLSLDCNYFFTGTSPVYYGNSFKDVNGDGLPDIVRWTAGQKNGYVSSSNATTNGNQVFLNTGTGFKLDPNFLLPTTNDNDPNASVVTLEYNNSYAYGNSFQDVNGDGLPDVIRWDTAQGNGSLGNTQRGNQVFINTGSRFVTDSFFALPTVGGKVSTLDFNSLNAYGNSYKDINGDGILDIVRWDTAQDNRPPGTTQRGNQILLGAIGRKEIKRVYSNSGGEDMFSFKGIREFTNSQKVGLNTKIPAGYKSFVVVSHTSDDKNGNISKTTYQYQGADYYYSVRNNINSGSPFDKRFTGFNEVIKTNPDLSTATTLYHQDNGQTGNEPADSYALIGKVYEETINRNEGGDIFTRTRISYYPEKNLGNNAKSILVWKELEQTFDGYTSQDNGPRKDTGVEYAYDTYGNVIKKTNWGEVVGNDDGSFTDATSSNDEFVESISYANNVGNYIVGLPSVDTVADQSGAKVSESKIYYDGLALGSVNIGNQTKKENWILGSNYTSTQTTYNTYGLPIKFTNEIGAVTTYNYEPYNLYPANIVKTVIDNNNNVQIIYNYDYDYSTGQVKQTIDPNGFTYQTTFDPFGRVLSEIIPDPNSNSPGNLVQKSGYVYNDTPLATSVRKTDYFSDSNAVDTYQYFDGFGRLIQERSEATGTGNPFNVRDIVYNNLGQVQKESLRYQDSGSLKTSPTNYAYLYTNYTYDIMGRTINISNSVGASRITYDDWETTSADPDGNIKNFYKDAYGNLVKVEEKNVNDTYTTKYEWDGNKNLKKITDALGNVRHFTYDGLGRRLTAEDLNNTTDVWSYTYDPVGNLIGTKSPKGETVLYSYDLLNRVVGEFFPTTNDPVVTYLYDSGTNDIGKLHATFKDGVNTNYAYNSNGSIATENVVMTAENKTYSTSYTYDRQGNITYITYPDGSKVRYTYNTAGELSRIERSEDGTTFVDVVSSFGYSPTGQVTTIAYANGTTTTNTYDDKQVYRLTRKLTQKNNSTELQDLNYTYDAVGNILSIQDLANGNAKTTYSYDNLNRLTHASLPSPAKGQPYDQTFVYDAIGNILSGPAGTYTYGGGGGSNPHAVTGITSADLSQKFAYDKNGNMINKTTTSYSAVLNASVNPNGKETQAGFSGGTLQDIGSGNSAVPLTPLVLPNLSPSSTVSSSVTADNGDDGQYFGSNSVNLSIPNDSAPVILSYFVSHITRTSATFGGEIYGNGRSTSYWYEYKHGSITEQSPTYHIDDCNNASILSTFSPDLKKNTSYEFRIVAQNEKGGTSTNWISFSPQDSPTPPPPMPPIQHPPYLESLTVTPNVPMSQLNNVNYTWNYKNQLTEVSNSTSDNTYLYDYAGARVKATVTDTGNNKTYKTYYPNKFYEYVPAQNGNASEKTKYIYAGGTLIASIKTDSNGTNPSYIHTDHLGGTNVVSNNLGNATETIEYYPFGGERVCSGPGATACDAEKKYIGQYFDVDTSLNYLNARYYNSYLGRFISEDPMFWGQQNLLDPQSLNSYSYARNNPISLSDPSGQSWGTFWEGATSFITDTAAFVSQHPAEAIALVVAGVAVAAVAPEFLLAAGVVMGAVSVGTAVHGALTATNADDRDRYLGEGFTSTLFTIFDISALKAFKTAKASEEALNAIRLQRENIWRLAKNTGEPEVERIAQRLFQESDTVPGGTAGGLKYEKQTGELLSRTGHEQAAKDTIVWIDRTLPEVNEAGQNLLTSFRKGLVRILNKQY